MYKFSQRINDAEEAGFMAGINGLAPVSTEKLPYLYRDGKRTASDNWLTAIYCRAYYHGRDERIVRSGEKVIPYDAKEALIYRRMRKADIAFQYGKDARMSSDLAVWFADMRLNGMMAATESEGENAFLVDSWIAGFSLKSEEIEDDIAEFKKEMEEHPEDYSNDTDEEEKEYMVSYSRMKKLRNAYENNEELDPDSEDGQALEWFRTCAEKLNKYGSGFEVKCLSCINLFRTFGRKGSDYDEVADEEDEERLQGNCECFCVDSHQQLNFYCQPELSWLEEYYTVEAR